MRAGLRWSTGITLVLVALGGVGVGAGVAAHEIGDPESGGRLFVENCAVCHGVDGKGRFGANLNDFPGIAIDAALVETIRNGIPGTRMPGWGEEAGGPLSENDIEDLTAYILVALGGTEPLAPLPTYQPEPVVAPPGIPGDAAAGSLVYQANCTVCSRRPSEVLERAGEDGGRGAAPFEILVRRAAARERGLRQALANLDDGYGVVEAAVRDLLDAG